MRIARVASQTCCKKGKSSYSPLYVNRIWGIRGSSFNISTAIFYLLRGTIDNTASSLEHERSLYLSPMAASSRTNHKKLLFLTLLQTRSNCHDHSFHFVS